MTSGHTCQTCRSCYLLLALYSRAGEMAATISESQAYLSISRNELLTVVDLWPRSNGEESTAIVQSSMSSGCTHGCHNGVHAWITAVRTRLQAANLE